MYTSDPVYIAVPDTVDTITVLNGATALARSLSDKTLKDQTVHVTISFADTNLTRVTHIITAHRDGYNTNTVHIITNNILIKS